MAGSDARSQATRDSQGLDGQDLDPRGLDPRGLGASLVDPREGDVEDDASSTKQRSLLAIAGSLLAEISLPKLLLAWIISIVVPGILLGLTPLVVTAWLATISGRMVALTGIWAALVLALLVVVGLIGWRPLLRSAEKNFWSLNALAVQPGYALCREALRHLAERVFGRHFNPAKRARLRAMSAAGAGIILCVVALGIAALAWPASRWAGSATDLLFVGRLIGPTLANAVVIVAGYLAAASLVWGIADASMDQPLDLMAFDAAPAEGRTWRVAHLSDVHIVGERYGFRVESGRSGPRGNDRLERVVARIEAIHSAQPLDLILISGDVTDAGRSSEWGEFLDIVARHPNLAGRMLILPGNHDVNIVDRANPARLDLPYSPARRLRQVRALSAMAAVQGDRVYVIDHDSRRLKGTLADALLSYRQQVAAFADAGTLRLSAGLGRLWEDLFPMLLPPDREDGLGVLILNSNAETHFSFTNALGMISAEQVRRFEAAVGQFPRARWIVAVHHHVIEYPMPVAAFSVRVGTALINGSWFVRRLRSLAGRAVVMHGHRHIDWIGECGGVRIVSAPSPVMEAMDDEPTYFYIHTLAAGADGRLRLLSPERIDIAGVATAAACG